MAKRFVDTNIWKKVWFRTLSMEYKLFWFYLLDTCDHAGLWEIDFELAEFLMKIKLDPVECEKIFDEQILKISDSKWFVRDFCFFQYGQLKGNNKPHISVINLLKRNNLLNFVDISDNLLPNSENYKKKLKILQRDNFTCGYCGIEQKADKLELDHIIPVSKGGKSTPNNLITSCQKCNRYKSNIDVRDFMEKFKNTYNTPWGISQRVLKIINTPKDKEEDKDKAQDKSKAKEEESVLLEADAAEIYKEYPRHEGGRKAIEAILKALKKVPKETLLKSVKDYQRAKSESEPKWIKLPTTWFNQECWHDDLSGQDLPEINSAYLPDEWFGLPQWQRDKLLWGKEKIAGKEHYVVKGYK